MNDPTIADWMFMKKSRYSNDELSWFFSPSRGFIGCAETEKKARETVDKLNNDADMHRKEKKWQHSYRN